MEIIDDRSCFSTAISFSANSDIVELFCVISARRTIRFSILYFLLRITWSRLFSSWACTSVRNPKRPRFIPRIGIWWLAIRLAVFSKVPSPPRLIAMSPEILLLKVLNWVMSSRWFSVSCSANSRSNRMVAP